MDRMERGFTLIELLVSVVVFAFVALGIYYLYDSGRWFYLQSEKKANMQENGRLLMEAMEREMRLIGFGIPSGGQIGGNVTLNPAIFEGGVNFIGFRGDVDTVNTFPIANVSGGSITVEEDTEELACPAPPMPIIIVQRGRNWQSTNCTATSEDTLTISPAAVTTFAASETEIFSPVHVFYRFPADADSNGICDQATATLPDYSQCIVQRAERRDLLPQTDPVNEAAWQTFATNISEFRLRYFRKTSGGPVELAVPLGIVSNSVDLIRLEITATDRTNRAGQFQSSDFQTEILVRKHRY